MTIEEILRQRSRKYIIEVVVLGNAHLNRWKSPLDALEDLLLKKCIPRIHQNNSVLKKAYFQNDTWAVEWDQDRRNVINGTESYLKWRLVNKSVKTECDYILSMIKYPLNGEAVDFMIDSIKLSQDIVHIVCRCETAQFTGLESGNEIKESRSALFSLWSPNTNWNDG